MKARGEAIEVLLGKAQSRRDGAYGQIEVASDLASTHPLELAENQHGALLETELVQDPVEELAMPLALDQLLGTWCVIEDLVDLVASRFFSAALLGAPRVGCYPNGNARKERSNVALGHLIQLAVQDLEDALRFVLNTARLDAQPKQESPHEFEMSHECPDQSRILGRPIRLRSDWFVGQGIQHTHISHVRALGDWLT